jgi:hypothetical protein
LRGSLHNLDVLTLQPVQTYDASVTIM